MMASDGPTVYATLMNEAIADARKTRNGLIDADGGLNDVLATFVSKADRRDVDAAVSSALREVYVRGVQHGYTQAVQRLDSNEAQVGRRDPLSTAVDDAIDTYTAERDKGA
jgi:hypothetical protein